MDRLDLPAIERRIQSLEDVDLQRAVALERTEWREEAVEIALREMRQRGLPVLSEAAYLEAHPEDEVGDSGICHACEEEGIALLGVDPVLLILVGVRAIPTGDPCRCCRSQVVRLWWPLIPVVPLGRYRVRRS